MQTEEYRILEQELKNLRIIQEQIPDNTLLPLTIKRLEQLIHPFKIGDQVSIKLEGSGKILPEGVSKGIGVIFSSGKHPNSFVVRLDQAIAGELLWEVEQEHINKLENV